MTSAQTKASLGDYIKLLQLSKEMAPPEKTVIRVMWIDEPEEGEEPEDSNPITE